MSQPSHDGRVRSRRPIVEPQIAVTTWHGDHLVCFRTWYDFVGEQFETYISYDLDHPWCPASPPFTSKIRVLYLEDVPDDVLESKHVIEKVHAAQVLDIENLVRMDCASVQGYIFPARSANFQPDAETELFLPQAADE